MHALLRFEIPKRSRYCSGGGERLNCEEDIRSVLYEEKHSEKLIRRDFCPACYSQAERSEFVDTPKISWTSGGKKKAPSATGSSSRVEKAFSLLQELMHSPEEFEKEIFVLCLFLARSRQMVLRKEFRSGPDVFHLYETSEGECLTVKTLLLSSEEVNAIRLSLASKLSG